MMEKRNTTEMLVDSSQRKEAEQLAQVLTSLKEQRRVDLESFLKAVDFLEQREGRTA